MDTPPCTLSTMSPLSIEKPLTGKDIDNLPTAPPRQLLIDHKTQKLRTDDLPVGTHINPNESKPSAIEFQLPMLQGTHELENDNDQDHNLKGYERQFRIFKPKDFGLSTWNPAEMDINTHLDIVAKCVDEARSMGATETNLIRLLIRTMPEDYQFLNEFITSEKRNNYETFAAEVSRVLSERALVQMTTFLSASKKPGEHILAYFYRIATLYRSSNRLDKNTWNNDSTHVLPVWAKMNEALSADKRGELMRRLEQKRSEKGQITMNVFKKQIVEISKLGWSGQLRLSTDQSITALEELNYQERVYDSDEETPLLGWLDDEMASEKQSH